MRQQAIGRESEPGTIDVEKGAIIKFAEAIGDDNPLYSDEVAARASRFGGLIAPPTFLRSALSARPDLPFDVPFERVLDGGSDWEYFVPVRPETASAPFPASKHQRTQRSHRPDADSDHCHHLHQPVRAGGGDPDQHFHSLLRRHSCSFGIRRGRPPLQGAVVFPGNKGMVSSRSMRPEGKPWRIRFSGTM